MMFHQESIITPSTDTFFSKMSLESGCSHLNHSATYGTKSALRIRTDETTNPRQDFKKQPRASDKWVGVWLIEKNRSYIHIYICYVMLCYVISYHIISYYLMLCYIILYIHGFWQWKAALPWCSTQKESNPCISCWCLRIIRKSALTPMSCAKSH